MSLRTISEITEAVDTFRKSQVQTQLRQKWDGDIDLYRLNPYNAGKGYYSYTSNAPRVLIKKIIAMLCQANLFIRIPGDLKNKKDRQIASTIERFLYGSFNLNDNMLLRRFLPTFREQMAFLLTLRGRAGFRVYITRDEQGNAIPEMIPLDPYQMSYRRGATGLIWGCRTYSANPLEMADLYPNLAEHLKKQTKDVKVHDSWDEEINTVIVDKKWAKEPDKHGLDECPVHLVMVGAMPDIESSYTNVNAERGDGALDSNRNIYPLMNKTMSDALTIVRRGVKVPLGIWSDDGLADIDGDIWQVEKGGHTKFTKDVEIKPLIEPSMPADTAPLLGAMSGELQRGGISHVSWGELGFRLSGYAINSLDAAIVTVIKPFAQALEQAYTLASISLLTQFAKGGFDKVEVMGRTSTNEAFGYPEKLTIKPKEVKKDWYPEVQLLPITPKDDAQRMLLAVQAKREGLLSTDTIREDYLNVPDLELEQMKVDKEFAINLPMIRLERIYWALKFEGEDNLAEYVWSEMKRQMAMAAQASGGTPATTPSPTEEMAMETPGVGMPPGETGMPTSVMPPETLGGMPPGAAGARMTGEGEI